MKRQAGIAVHKLDWTRWFDPRVLANLRTLLHSMSPDVIHVWRLPALRMLALVAGDLLPRVVMSAPLPAKGELAWWDRWLLARVRCLAVAGASDQERCVRQGAVPSTLRIVPTAVGNADARDVEASSHSIACVAPLERAAGVRHTIWTFDILLQLYPEASLRLVGSGSEDAALRALTGGLQNADRVHFLAGDPTEVLRTSEIVWIPSLANTGRQAALEAMAHGRPVIASDVPCLREVIRDGDTGYLVPPGDVVQLARRTHALFVDPALRERIGEAARQYVEMHHPLGAAVERWQELYRSCAA